MFVIKLEVLSLYIYVKQINNKLLLGSHCHTDIPNNNHGVWQYLTTSILYKHFAHLYLNVIKLCLPNRW